MIDKYFRRPVFWDFVFAIILSGLAMLLNRKGFIAIPKEEYLYSVVSDLSTISLTMVGFILTLVTVLISFKSTSKLTKETISEFNTLYEIFFASELYFQTVKLLKNGIKALTVVALIGYGFKLSINSKNYSMLFFYSIFEVVIIFFTIWRCVIILSKIIKIQEQD